MTCEVAIRNGAVHVTGEMTIYGAAGLQPELAAALEQCDPCTLSLAEVTEFDTTGLQILIMARRACVMRGVELRVTEQSDCVREALELVHLTKIHAVPEMHSP